MMNKILDKKDVDEYKGKKDYSKFQQEKMMGK